MATFTITAAGTGLQIVDDSGVSRIFSAPDIKLNSVAIWPRTAPTIDIRTATGVVQIALGDTVTVGGVAGFGTLPALFDQIKAVLPSGGGSLRTFVRLPRVAWFQPTNTLLQRDNGQWPAPCTGAVIRW